MIHRVEVLLNVQINDPFATGVQIFQRLFHCCMTASVRPESVAMVAEIAFIAHAQYLRRCLLDHPVHYRRYPQRPLLSICLRDVYSPYRLRFISLRPDLLLDFFSVLRKIFVKRFHRHLIDARRTFVALDSMDRRFDVLLTQNPVNQFHLLHLLLLVKLHENFPPPFDLHEHTFPLVGSILGFGLSVPCSQRFALLRH